MKKPVVHYSRTNGDDPPKVGYPALIYPTDHPSNWVSNTQLARTSPVVRVGQKGEFETMNTLYRPVKVD